jgi:hypothetical protein
MGKSTNIARGGGTSSRSTISIDAKATGTRIATLQRYAGFWNRLSQFGDWKVISWMVAADWSAQVNRERKGDRFPSLPILANNHISRIRRPKLVMNSTHPSNRW